VHDEAIHFAARGADLDAQTVTGGDIEHGARAVSLDLQLEPGSDTGASWSARYLGDSALGVIVMVRTRA
jgi:hypothetical protein